MTKKAKLNNKKINWEKLFTRNITDQTNYLTYKLSKYKSTSSKQVHKTSVHTKATKGP